MLPVWLAGRSAAVATLCGLGVAVYLTGRYDGAQGPRRELAEYRQQMADLAVEQQRVAALAQRRQQEDRDATERQYRDRVAALRERYRVQQHAGGAGAMPGLSIPAGGADGGASDVASGAGGIEADCAVTTAQLLELQAWVARQ